MQKWCMGALMAVRQQQVLRHIPAPVFSFGFHTVCSHDEAVAVLIQHFLANLPGCITRPESKILEYEGTRQYKCYPRKFPAGTASRIHPCTNQSFQKKLVRVGNDSAPSPSNLGDEAVKGQDRRAPQKSPRITTIVPPVLPQISQ